ncbi:MAG: glycosyltransferase family 9 protein [Bacteroidetes bacterium]|nr:glycosyltransferase family 9 protein [Bacteroidota bacterium]
MLKENSKIIISRTDSIGDVILTLPLCGYLKQKYPAIKIYFLASAYTIPVVACCEYVDEIINFDELKSGDGAEKLKNYSADILIHVFPNKLVAKLAKQALIPNRIGTSHRFFHLFTCNRLVNFTRKKSDLHEAQLNFKLLQPLGITAIPTLSEMHAYYGLTKLKSATHALPKTFIDPLKFNLIIHAKSKGSAREWPIENYSQLIDALPPEKYNIIISGVPADAEALKVLVNKPNVVNVVGKLKLDEFILLISMCDGLLACSTGPLHIAAALGKFALGIYPPMKPIHPGRWAPIGKKAEYLVLDKSCNDCKKNRLCKCINEITPKQVLLRLTSYTA